MKILFDQGTPVPLQQALVEHVVFTAFERGWSALANGELLSTAEAQAFEALITTDQNLRYQQNLTGRKIAIFVLPFASWPRLRPHVMAIAEAISALSAGDFVEWSLP